MPDSNLSAPSSCRQPAASPIWPPPDEPIRDLVDRIVKGCKNQESSDTYATIFLSQLMSALVDRNPTTPSATIRDGQTFEREMLNRFGNYWQKEWRALLSERYRREGLSALTNQRLNFILPFLVAPGPHYAAHLIAIGLRRPAEEGDQLIHAGLKAAGKTLPESLINIFLTRNQPLGADLDRLMDAILSAKDSPTSGVRSARMMVCALLAYRLGTEEQALRAVRFTTILSDRLDLLIKLVEEEENYPNRVASAVLEPLAKSFVRVGRTKDLRLHQWRVFGDIAEHLVEWSPRDSESVPAWLMAQPDVVLQVAVSSGVWSTSPPWVTGTPAGLQDHLAGLFAAKEPFKKLAAAAAACPSIQRIPAFRIQLERADLTAAARPTKSKPARRSL